MLWLKAGRAFLLCASGEPKSHLRFVLTDCDPATGRCVIVMVVSAKSYTDKTVVLRAGDHPFIEHESHVSYGDARYFTEQQLKKAQRLGQLVMQPDMSLQLLTRVRLGLLTSSRTIHEIKDFCRRLFPSSSHEGSESTTHA